MASSSHSIGSPELASLRTQKRLLGWGLIWAACVLEIFAFWLATTLAEWLIIRVVFAVLGLVSLGLGVWQLLRGLPSDSAQQTQLLEQNRRLLGILFFVVGAVVGVVGVWILFTVGTAALGQALALAAFSLIALGSAAKLLATPQAVPFQERFVNGLVTRRSGIALALCLFGVALIILGIVLRFGREVTPENPPIGMPLWFGPILLGLLSLGTGAYLLASPDLSAPRARLVVLIYGGSFGMLLALLTLWQAWNWRAVFFGGLPAWRGPQSWQVWVSAYVELAGLILMFACLGLARPEVRVNPVLRRVLYGYNAVLTGLLLLVILLLLNIVIYVAFPFTFNWSEKGGMYALAPKSIDILEKLDRPTKVYITMARQTPELRHLLNNAQAVTDKLEVEQINPDRDLEKYKELARKYPELIPDQFGSGRGVLLVFGSETGGKDQLPHKFIAQDKLVEQNFMRRTESFIGEKVIMQELQFFMSEKKKSKVYFLQGEGELSLKRGGSFFRLQPYDSMSQLGTSLLIERLRKENIEARGLSFAPGKSSDEIVHVAEAGEGKRKEIPEDAGVVVIAGPSTVLSQETLDGLERYMDGKGRLVVLLDAITDRGGNQMVSTGLEDFLKKYNVEVTNQYVHSFGEIFRDPRTGMPVPRYDRAPTQVYATPNRESHSQLAKKFAGEFFVLTTARVIKTGSGPGGRYQAQTLLEVSPRLGLSGTAVQPFIWAEEVAGLRDPGKHNVDMWRQQLVFKKATQDALPVAVTVHEGTEKPRMVVIGDAEFISDRYLFQPPGETPPDVYYSFFASMIDWLAERPGLGIRPREAGTYTMKSEAKQESGRMVLIPGLLMILSVLGCGVGVWVVRRR